MTVEDYTHEQTPEMGAILRRLQQIIRCAAPGTREDTRWKVPFYTYQKRSLCYLNILKITHKDQPTRVDLTFVAGNDLPDEVGMFQSRNRKRVKSMGVETMTDREEDIIRIYVQAALMLSENRVA